MEKERVSPAVLWRLGLATGLLVIASACGSTGGCQGCATDPIPGGFNQQHRFDNAMQVRLSSSGIDFMEQNFESLVSTLVPGGLSFTIPPTGCSGSQKVCCDTSKPPCDIAIDITNVQITPTPKSTAKLDLRAKIKTTNPINFAIKLLWTIDCNATYDSGKSGQPDLGLHADIDLVVDPNDSNKLKISRGNTQVSDFDSGDIDISGGIDCTIADWFKSLFKGQIESQLMSAVDDTVDAMLKDLPMGQEGRFDVASFMSSFSPRTTGVMDYLLWAGGYAEAENAGMSVGVMGGFRASKHNPCVPDCEAAGASCSPPPKAAIPRSQVFRGNTRPQGDSFDVGIGVHREALDLAAYGLYSSGGLCLDVTTQTVSQLSSSMFALLVPSLNVLTSGNNVPMMLAIRPRKPPTVTLGKGTYHQDSSGNVVIDDPLLKIAAKDFAADVYIQLEERFVRVFTIVGDLEVPALLYPDSDGKLQPILGDLTKALTNITVENADLISEDPKTLASLFPTLMGLAASFLAGGFQPIELPAIQGLQLQLGPGSITTSDAEQVLAIFANLAMVQNTKGPFDGEGIDVDTEASIDGLELPDHPGPGIDPSGGPAVTLRLGARLPPALQGKPVEYSFRVDGGFYRPFTDSTRVVVRDPLLWLEGQHSIEVVARIKDAPRTLDPTPVKLSLTVDRVPPTVRLVPTATGVRAEARDAVTPRGAIELSWSVDGKPFGPFGDTRELSLPAGTPVVVKARDRSGNVAMTSRIAGVLVVDRDEQGGCSVSGGAAKPLGLIGLVALLALLFRRRD